ncbi:MAG TPA: DUF748 domain-containing protein [Rhodocyclaceae bacterium]|nr:DUF748 domain-containing protein [Rhodocyclaceae bacterium]
MDIQNQLQRLRRYRPVAIGFVVVILVFGAFGFLAGPPIARSLLIDTMSEKLHRPVSIGAISINPYALTVRVADLKIGETGGETAGFDELFLNLGLASIFRAAPVVEEFHLTGPRVHLVREASGRYNISDLLDEWLKPSDSPPSRFSINNIRITAGRVDFDDRPVGKQHAITDINLALPFISNLAYQANTFTEPAFSASINGAPLNLTGKSKPFAEVQESELKLDLGRFELARYLAYSPVSLPFAIAGGYMDTDLSIRFRNDGKQPATLGIAGQVNLRDLRLLEHGDSPLLTLDQLDIPVTGVDPLNGYFHFGSIHIAGLETFLRVGRDGSLNWLALAGKLQGSKTTAEQKPEPTGKPVEWSVDGLQLAKAALHWQDDSNPQQIAANVTNIEGAVGKVNGTFAEPIAADISWSIDAAPHASAEHFEIKDARIDLPKHKINLGKVVARGLKLALRRQIDGSFSGLRPPALKSGTHAATQTKGREDSQPWIVELTKAEVTDAGLRFDDKAVTPATTQVLELNKLSLENFSTAPKSSASLTVSARLNKKGDLQANGTLQAVPFASRLKLDVRGIELLPLQPYFGEKLNVTITKGQVAGKGEVTLNLADNGSVGASYRGQVTVGNFHSVDKANSADFLTWKSFHLDKIDLKALPFALAIGEVALSDFFANLIVSPEGKLNLLQLVKKDSPPEAADSNSAPSPTPPPLSAATTPPTPVVETSPPPIRIDQVTLQGGTINFADNFIKPNYSAHLTEIGGRITGLSSAADSAADLDLRGAYDGAPVTIAGKLNPLAAVASLDIKAEVRGVEMTPLSPYAGKYAGYAIEKGKLSLFLGYKIENNRLQADNRIFLDQLTFGDKVESPDATKLPVRLAVALLKNRRGEIDINLPISGSLNDPKFSVGGIIVQVIVNVITKAITAPFALLGSLFGGGAELSHVTFADGRVTLNTAMLKRLESLAKALDDRPALKLEITGRVDPEKDREGLRLATLEHKVKAQKLAQMVKEGKEAGAADDVTIDDKEYLALLEQAYKQEKFPKPRNFIGMAKTLPRDEMEKLMLANAPASDDDLRDLAGRRAKAVADWLAGTGKIPRERIFLLPPKLAVDGSGPKDAPLSRVDFSLK